MDLGHVWNAIIRGSAGMSERDFVGRELQRFLSSPMRRDILTGRRYYEGDHDIKQKRREVALNNQTGHKVNLSTLPNNKIVDNKFDDLVDQKVNYLLGNPLEIKTEDDLLSNMLGKQFTRTLLNVAKDAYIGGRGYLHPYIADDGTLTFRRMKPEQVIPYWRDDDHAELDAFIYFYEVEVYHLAEWVEKETYVEFYKPNGISYYIYKNGSVRPNLDKGDTPYIAYNGQTYNWPKVPLLCFKANHIEQPLIKRVKCLQDGLNTMYSNFMDRMEEDPRNTLLVIRNYDGTDLAEFKTNLATYGAVKVRDEGGVETLSIDVNASNYDFIMNALKRAIIENGRGFDAKDDRMSNNPNMMNISSMYSDIDLDANEIEVEFQATLEQLVEFYQAYTAMRGLRSTTDVEFIFNRKTPVNEGEVIANCKTSVGILSNETIVANHPWTKDTAEELARLQQEQLQMMQQMAMQDYIMNGDSHDHAE